MADHGATDHVTWERRDRVLEVRLNRPDKRNALTDAMYRALLAAFDEAEADGAVRALLITGNGEAFTAGNDLNDFLAFAQRGAEPAAARFIRRLTRFAKPLLAAVHGAAVGIGTTLLLHCDLVVAAPSARLQLPFVNLGLVPEAASSLLLPRLVGLQRASEMLLLGEPIDAERALALGLVNRVVPEAELLPTARDLAAAIAARPPHAVRLTRALLRGDGEALRQRIDEELVAFNDQLASPELREAATAFLEKRKPDFSRF
jgi:enoyl-CoA hydratase/carnithine racemase